MPTPLFLEFTPSVHGEISAALENTRTYQGDAAAELFALKVSEALRKATVRLADEIAENETGKAFDQTDEAASIQWAQPVYRLRVETAKRRKRGSSVGLWYVFYGITDAGGVGKPDTMRVLSFQHSAARPVGEENDPT